MSSSGKKGRPPKDTGVLHSNWSCKENDSSNCGQSNDNFLLPVSLPNRTRGAKRKNVDQQANSVGVKRNKSEASLMVKTITSQTYPTEHPFNRDGYRYFLAETDMHAPNRQEFDESSETAGKPIPSYMYRVFRPSIVTLSPNDRAPQLKLSEDRLQVTGEKGYSVVRATHSVSRGAWFYEVRFVDQPECSHARIGWSQSLGCLQAPVGYDKFSYSWRKHYCQGGYKEGDVLGFYIFLPDSPSPSKGKQSSFDHMPPTYKDLPLIKFKNYFYYEEKDEVQQALKLSRPLKGSKMMFYKNGVCQGVAYSDFYRGAYYPAVSLYKNATVRMNFGPNFQYPPTDVKYRPFSDRVKEMLVEQAISDILFFIENDGKLTLDA